MKANATNFHLCLRDKGHVGTFDTKAAAFAEGHRLMAAGTTERFWVHDGTFCVDEFDDTADPPDALSNLVRGAWNNCD